MCHTPQSIPRRYDDQWLQLWECNDHCHHRRICQLPHHTAGLSLIEFPDGYRRIWEKYLALSHHDPAMLVSVCLLLRTNLCCQLVIFTSQGYSEVQSVIHTMVTNDFISRQQYWHLIKLLDSFTGFKI